MPGEVNREKYDKLLRIVKLVAKQGCSLDEDCLSCYALKTLRDLKEIDNVGDDAKS